MSKHFEVRNSTYWRKLSHVYLLIPSICFHYHSIRSPLALRLQIVNMYDWRVAYASEPNKLDNSSPVLVFFFFFLDLAWSTCAFPSPLEECVDLAEVVVEGINSWRDTATPLSGAEEPFSSSDLLTFLSAEGLDVVDCSGGRSSQRTVLKRARETRSIKPRGACWLSAVIWVNALEGGCR